MVWYCPKYYEVDVQTSFQLGTSWLLDGCFCSSKVSHEDDAVDFGDDFYWLLFFFKSLYLQQVLSVSETRIP